MIDIDDINGFVSVLCLRNHVTCILSHEAGMTNGNGARETPEEREKTEPTKPYPYSTSSFCARGGWPRLINYARAT